MSASVERGFIAAPALRDRNADFSMIAFHVSRQYNDGAFRIGVSRLIEPETMLGGKLGDLFGRQGSQTWFADTEAQLLFDDSWSFAASARRGWTTLTSGRLITSSYSIDLTKHGVLSSDGAIKIRLAQPLRVERGSISMIVPTSWDYKTETFTEASRQLNLSPSGRERILEIGYLRRLRRGSISLHFYHRTDPAHLDRTQDDIGGAVRTNFRL